MLFIATGWKGNMGDATEDKAATMDRWVALELLPFTKNLNLRIKQQFSFEHVSSLSSSVTEEEKICFTKNITNFKVVLDLRCKHVVWKGGYEK